MRLSSCATHAEKSAWPLASQKLRSKLLTGVVRLAGAVGTTARCSAEQRSSAAGTGLPGASARKTTPGHARATVRARLDLTEDPEDVYRVYVPPARIVRLTIAPDTDVDVDLWKPTATTVFARGADRVRNLLATGGRRGRTPERMSVRNRTKRGFYAYLDVYLPRNGPLDAAYTVSAATARR